VLVRARCFLGNSSRAMGALSSPWGMPSSSGVSDPSIACGSPFFRQLGEVNAAHGLVAGGRAAELQSFCRACLSYLDTGQIDTVFAQGHVAQAFERALCVNRKRRRRRTDIELKLSVMFGRYRPAFRADQTVAQYCGGPRVVPTVAS
jgi:hypothetical protein